MQKKSAYLLTRQIKMIDFNEKVTVCDKSTVLLFYSISVL